MAQRSEARRGRRDAGQVVPLMAGVLALVAVLAVGLVLLGNLVARRAQAQTAADAAALAGAARGRAAALQVAGENDGDLESFVVKGPEVEVTVRVGDARATSRARREW
ncbi:MAG TPA: pilus assembly protein TadG-related protein [Acidimicrobiales bacterium]